MMSTGIKSDRMSPVPFKKLVLWVLEEYQKEKSIFGIPESRFYRKTKGGPAPLPGTAAENPIGPAAGPHTQLAQNIVAAYLAGARYFELKTVQVIDGEELPVSKPCILARDEGYNVEWSTELTVPDAFNEYIKAYFLLKLLSKELNLGGGAGFAFNMSVGYDLQGIQSPKIDAFLENMKNASKTAVWKECKNFLRKNLGLFKNVDAAFLGNISPGVCSSVTLSTLHGCPRQEIEKIAGYLLGVKKLGVYIKLNPTLLGYDFARQTLDRLGFNYLSFDDTHFREDLQYEDAIPMLRRLQSTAGELKLDFGVKLTNTFPVKIENGELPGEEMYMSGRALYPLTVSLAAKLAESMDGDIRISYSGGADYSNIGELLAAGVAPVTFATTLLKPGGYQRIRQLALLAEEAVAPQAGVSVTLLKALAEKALGDALYQKSFRQTEDRKLSKPVPLFDCFTAPCKEGCPIGQDAPEYIRLSEEGRDREAFELITAKNPFPFSTGTICARPCMRKCTRIDYDGPVDIRAAKLAAAEKGRHSVKPAKQAANGGFKAAVIGGGPAGLSAAYFLARNGVNVTVFEKRESLGGVLRHVIPEFRLPGSALSRDLELIESMGITVRLGEGGPAVHTLKKEGFRYIFLATGAWGAGRVDFEAEDGMAYDVLDFLEKFNTGSLPAAGKNVAVIGAGNSAMDAARAALRLPGVEGVTIVYRRTEKLMPADPEEFRLALEEGAVFKELLAPVSLKNGVLRCQKLKLGAPDDSGRRSPEPLSGQYEELPADTVVFAVGQKTDAAFLRENDIAVDKNGRPLTMTPAHETGVPGVFAGGDLLRGPATVVEAIADGLAFAKTVLEREGIAPAEYDLDGLFDKQRQYGEIAEKKGVLGGACAGQCLECGAVCAVCVEVCPNRANVAVRVPGMKDPGQILHIDSLCNACGNCETFCPYDSAPYRDKLTLYQSEAEFNAGENQGFWISGAEKGRFKARIGSAVSEGALLPDGTFPGVPAELARLMKTVLEEYRYIL